MKKRIVLISLFGLFLLAGCEKHEEKHEEKPRLAITQPLIQDMLIPRDYVCQIHAIQRIELRSLERGYLQHIYVDEGQKVKKGQLMFQITPNVYQSELKKFEAEARIAEIEYQNTKLLADQNIVSTNELAIVKAKLDKVYAEVNLAKTHLGFTKIRAPFSGLMDHLHVRVGSLLEEGEKLTTLSDNSKMWVYFNVSETEYLNFTTNQDKQKLKKVKLKMANGAMFEHEGVIETIEGEFDNETGNIELRATFPNPDGILRHGETGNIVMTSPLQKAIVIPQKATFEILDKKYVYVLGEHNKLQQRQIETAAELPHLYVIKEGLKAGEKILLDGLRKVRNGQEIDVKFQDPQKVISDLDVHAE